MIPSTKKPLIAGISAWMLSVGAMQANAACPAALNDFDIINCVGADLDGFDDGGFNWLTINVANGASIINPGLNAITLNDFGIYTINNLGTIGDNATIIGINMSGPDALVVNNLGNGLIQAIDDAISAVLVSDITIINGANATIRGDLDNSGFGRAIAVLSGNNVEIINYGTLVANFDEAIFIDGTDNVTITNYGFIQVAANFNANSIQIQNSQNIVITNHESISGNNNDGINISNSNWVSIDNTKNIAGLGISGDGLDINANFISITNSGTITGNNGIFIDDPITVSINNLGFITALNNGIQIASVGDEIISISNSGTISADGIGVLVSGQAATQINITNSGSISSTTAHAINLNVDFVLASITNNGGIISGNADGIRAVLGGATLFITNTVGIIEGIDDGIDLNDIINTTIVNSGSITGDNDNNNDGSGISAFEVANIIIVNNVDGSISTRSDALTDAAINISGESQLFQLENNGTITSESNGVLVFGVEAVEIVNSGKIIAESNLDDIGVAIDVFARKTVIHNKPTGLIENLSQAGTATDAIFIHDVLGIDDEFILVNEGDIKASLAVDLLGTAVHAVNIDSVGILNSGNIRGSQIGINVSLADQVSIYNTATGDIRGSFLNGGFGIVIGDAFASNDSFSLLNDGFIYGNQAVNVTNIIHTTIHNTLSGEMDSGNTTIHVIDLAQDGLELNDQLHLWNEGSITGFLDAIKATDIDFVAILNSGLILALNENAITVSNAMTTQIENTLTGNITAFTDNAIDVSGATIVSDSLHVKNDGLISAGNVAILSDSIQTVNLQNSGTISGISSLQATITVLEATTINIVNTGIGLIEGQNALGIEDAITIQNTIVNDGIFTLFNDGIIQAAGIAVSSFFVDTVSIQNNGTIEGDSDGSGSILGNGIFVSNAVTATIINTGSIISNSTNSEAIEMLSSFVDEDTLFIFNVGDIKANNDGIATLDVDTVTILNEQLIAGNVDNDNVDGGTGILIRDAITTIIQNGLAGNIQAGIYVTDVNADQAADTLTIVNDGKIEGKDVAQPLARNGINVVDIETIWIENHGTGEISGFDTAIDITNALDTTILNSFGGLISGEIFGITAIDLIASPNDQITILNDGTISTFDGNALAAIQVVNIADVLIGNTGLIESVGYGIEIIAPQTVEINNTGTIQSLNGFVAFDAIRVLGDILVLDESVTVNNDGLVQAINAGGDAVTVADVGDFTFNNGSSGQVIADGFGFDIFNVTTAVINNHGLIESQSANIAINSVNSQDTVNLFETSTTIGDINLNELDDVVNIYAGAVVDGHIDASTNANNDFDVINFDKVNVDNGAFNLDDAEHFEEAHLIDGYWTMTGTGATHFDLFSVEGGTLAIGGPNEYNDLIIDTDLYKQEMPGTLRIKLDASTSGVNDHLFITGVADLGGTLSLDLDLQKTLDLKPGETREYTILTADGGVNSVFDEELPTDFQYKSLVLTRDVIYEPNDVIVFIGRLAYEDVEGLEYFDNISEASYLTKILSDNLYSGDIEALLNNLDTIDNLDQFRDALEAVDGQAYFAFSKMAVDAAESTTRALSDGLNKRNPDTIDEDYKVAMFLQPVYGTSTRDSFEEHTEFDSRGWGVVGGVGYLVTNNVEVGVVGAYYDMESEANLRNGNRSGDADGDIYSIRGYVKLDNLVDGNLYVIGSLGYAWGDYDMDRTVAIRPTAEEAGILREFEGSTDSSTIEASIEAGYRVKAGIVNITPYVSTNYAYIQVDDFTESDKGLTNSNLALHVDPDEIQHLSTEAGVNVDARIEMGTMTLVPSFNVNAERVWSDLEHDSNNGFASLGGLDTPIESNDAGRNTVGARLGLDLEVNKSVSFGISGDLRQGDDTAFWGFSGNVKAKF